MRQNQLSHTSKRATHPATQECHALGSGISVWWHGPTPATGTPLSLCNAGSLTIVRFTLHSYSKERPSKTVSCEAILRKTYRSEWPTVRMGLSSVSLSSTVKTTCSSYKDSNYYETGLNSDVHHHQDKSTITAGQPQQDCADIRCPHQDKSTSANRLNKSN